MPSAAATRATWAVYEGEPLAPDTRLEWGRPCTEAVATMLAMHCGHRKEDTLRYLLPALLVHDLRNCDDTRAQFAPTAVEGECAVGARAMPIKPLAVLHWALIPGRPVDGLTSRLVKELPRVKRSVPKALAVRYCAALVEAHCLQTLAKQMACPKLPAKLRDAEHWQEQARICCCDVWQLPEVPESCREAIDASAAAWRRARSAGEQRKKQRTLDQMFGT